MLKKEIAVLLALLLIFSLCACGGTTQAAQINQPSSEASAINAIVVPTPVPNDPEAAEKSTTYLESMDTIMTLTAYGSNRNEVLNLVSTEIRRLNDLFSIGVYDSDIATLNRNGENTVSSEVCEVITRALEVYDLSGGLFDITITPIMELWGFTSQQYHVPAQEELSAALARTGIEKINFNPETAFISLSGNAEVDLGGIAKGYTSHRVMQMFADNGITSATVSLGGNVQCLGLKPDGSKWKIGIRDPFGTETSLVCIIQIENAAVITSGGYERYFTDEVTGKTYIHIVDPNTGYPCESDLASVSIVSTDGTLADGLSTAVYIMGLEGGIQFWREHSELFDAIFITTEGDIYVTEGIFDSVTPLYGDLNIVNY